MRIAAWLSFAAAALVVGLHLGFWLLPAALFAAAAAAYLLRGRRAVAGFLVLLPAMNSLPDLWGTGYPFNYLAPALFALAGLAAAAGLRRDRLDLAFPGARTYKLFLGFLWISALTVAVRWTYLPGARLALGRDIQVAPGEQRLSFAIVFPVVTLFLFSFGPLAAGLLRRHAFGEGEVLRLLQIGTAASAGLAALQLAAVPDFLSQPQWIAQLRQAAGGGSDFNALGFFAGFLFLWAISALTRSWPGLGPRKRILEAGLAAASLAGVFLSGCRTALLFVAAALVLWLASRRLGLAARAAALLAVAAVFLLFGGTIQHRLVRSSTMLGRAGSALETGGAPTSEFWRAVDVLASGRVQMAAHSLETIRRYPASGVGAGNFLFHLKYAKAGRGEYYEDLPLSQYLLILDETGLFGLAAFLAFLIAAGRARRGGRLVVWLTASAALALNFFLWFPECVVLLFAFIGVVLPDRAAAATGRRNAVPAGGPEMRGIGSGRNRRLSAIAAWAAVAVFAASEALTFDSLSPATWAAAKRYEFHYGFWYVEKAEEAPFRWSRARAGVLVLPDRPVRVRIAAAAPFESLPGKNQVVDLFWRGRRVRKIVFTSPGDVWWGPPAPGEGGFFELRVRPTFNLSRLGLSPETRDLGVQITPVPIK